jgi:DNA (cytosine-5)-methyltransferase 1
MSLTVGSLFSGIGGLDLGLERAGMEVIWQSEIDPYACKVLAKHWPKVPNHGNIKEINWGNIVRPDIICGGYPCQPFSTAGNRNGADDPRHLWPWVREAISRIRPQYAILENVRGHITLGLDTVLADLASIGYDAEWTIVSASSVGAPHQRDRVIIIAYPVGQLADTNPERRLYGQSQIVTTERWVNALRHIASGGTDVADTDSPSGQQQCQWEIQNSDPRGCGTDVANTNIGRQQELHGQALQQQQGRTIIQRVVEGQPNPHWWTIEPDVGRVANGVPKRMDRLRGLGNAVVPQVAELVGRMVMEHHNS